mgnify:CR=1 FL=1|jgi:hypothetical protein
MSYAVLSVFAFRGYNLETESLHKSAFSCNFTIEHPKTLKDVHFYHSINYHASLSCFYCNKSLKQQIMITPLFMGGIGMQEVQRAAIAQLENPLPVQDALFFK